MSLRGHKTHVLIVREKDKMVMKMGQELAEMALQIQQSPKKEKVKTPYKPRARSENRPLNAEQVQKIMLTCDNLRDQAMLHLGFNVGCRVSEVLSFMQDSIDEQQGQIKIWDEKKDVYRWVTPPMETINKIRTYINESKPGAKPIFDMSQKSAERIIQRWTMKALGFKRSWHTVRHTYISRCAENEINPAIVIANTGDAPATILKYYTHLSPGYMRKIIEAKPVYVEAQKVV